MSCCTAFVLAVVYIFCVVTSQIIHLWAPHPLLTDTPGVIFLFLYFAPAWSISKLDSSISFSEYTVFTGSYRNTQKTH